MRKNIPNFIPLYSTKYPMISDSPSGRSKGTLLVSARAAVRKTKKATGWATMPQKGIQPPMRLPLAAHQLLQVHRPVDHDDAEDGDAQGDLVGDHLRGGPQAAEHRVVVARGKAGEDHAVDPEREHRKDVEQRRVDLGDLELDDAVAQDEAIAERNGGKGHQGEEDREERAPACGGSCRRRPGRCLPW